MTLCRNATLPSLSGVARQLGWKIKSAMALGLLSMSATGWSQSMPAPVPDKDYGFAANCGSAGLRLTPLETIVCRNASLREKDAKMIALVREVEAEVSGVDGDSGRPLNPMAPDQKAWRKATQSRCKNADCLSAAYDTRIATIRSKWRQAF